MRRTATRDGEPDLDKAKQLVKDSGYEGEKVTVWTNNEDPRPAIADYYRDVLNQIGFEADAKTLDQQGLLRADRPEATDEGARPGFTNWYQDYPHPGDFIDVLLSTDSLKTEVTNNQGFVSDPELDKKLDELRAAAAGGGGGRVGALDEYVVNDQAHRGPVRLRGVELVLLGANGRRELRRASIRCIRTTGCCSA